jgi:hypothetical protein
MVIIIALDKEMVTVTANLPSLDKDWFLMNEALGHCKYELCAEWVFRYAEHFMYKEYFKPKYLIPNWIKLPNDFRESIKILGHLLYSLYELATQFDGVGYGLIMYQAARNEFKNNNYLLIGTPIKRYWIKEYKQKRGALRYHNNIFDETTPHLKELLDNTIRYSEGNDTFKKNVYCKFIDSYKAWCDDISTGKDWYTKMK